MKPLFRLALTLSLFAQTHIHAQEIPCAWSTVERIVAVGDVHADGDQLIACLRAGGVIDEQPCLCFYPHLNLSALTRARLNTYITTSRETPAAASQ
jgi:hypothetical protein